MALSPLTKKRKQIVKMKVEGKTPVQISHAMGIPQRTIQSVLERPEAQEALNAARMRAKLAVMDRAERVVNGTLDVVEKAIRDEDAKALDMSTRAALNLERLTQSASGESAKVEVSGQLNVDVRALLAKYAQG